mmetsp:Transcript_18169/g.28613  ORF Transcript_18169/g.28613 Transcript_18169/m.28613 type:complete len:248 (+) Transcript_18169:688-1431(+)
MPPVFGPLSSSSTRLWSCAGTIMEATLPSANAIQLHSSPLSNCSITTSSPALPKAFSSMTDFTAWRASSNDSGMSTPFPAARPLALTTTSLPASYSCFTYSQAFSYSPLAKFWYAAVGKLYFLKKSLENAFDASSSAAAFVGPKQGMPALLHASARPAQSGASGPTKTRATFFSVANLTRFSISLSFTGIFVMSRSTAVPPFPGAQKTWQTLTDSRNLQAIACSRPPLPTTSTLFFSLAVADRSVIN